jgi:hypothetical protein
MRRAGAPVAAGFADDEDAIGIKSGISVQGAA